MAGVYKIVFEAIDTALGAVDTAQAVADAAAEGTTVSAMAAAATTAAFAASVAAARNPTPGNVAAASAAVEASISMGIVKLAVDAKSSAVTTSQADIMADMCGIVSSISTLVALMAALVPGGQVAAASGTFAAVALQLVGLGLSSLDSISALAGLGGSGSSSSAFPFGAGSGSSSGAGSAPSRGGFMGALAGLMGRALTDPIVLDLNGDGVKLTSLANSSAYFDLHNSGFAVKTGWIDSSDGLLVVDRNGDGAVNGISELFGDAATDGFTALSAMDTNGDGVVNASDGGFSTLQVWVDADGDGETDSGELKSLSSLGITGINLNATETNMTMNGNVLGAIGSFTKADGTTGQVAEAFFDNSQIDSQYTGTYTLNPMVLLLPNLRGYGTLPDLFIAMSLDSTLLQMVEDLTNTTLANGATLDSQITAILYRWAGVTNVDSASRGSFMDAQHLEVLEKFLGEAYVNPDGGNNPTWQHQATLLENAYDTLFSAVRERLLVQGPLSSLFSDVSFVYNTDSLSGTADLNAAVASFEASAPTDVKQAAQYWTSLVSLVDSLANDLGIAQSAYTSSLESFFTQSNLPFSLAAVRNSGIVFGTDADDTISVSDEGAHYLSGGAGNDTIVGNSGDDTFDGGAGNDYLKGIAGNNTYIFGRGYGQDIIQNLHVDSGRSVLKFNSDTTSSDVKVSRYGNDLILSIIGTTDTITIQDCFALDNFHLSSIQFTDGVAWSYSDVVGLLTKGTDGSDVLVGDGGANILDGKAGNDHLKGWGGSDTYVFGRGYGQDTIDATHGSSNDKPILLLNPDTGSSDVSIKRSGNDLILTILGTTDTVTISDYFSSWVYRVNAINFSDGTSWDYNAVMAKVTTGTSGNDTIIGSGSLSEVLDGGAGNDYLQGWGNHDVYVFGRGYGQDTIYAIHTGSDDVSALSFNADTLPADVLVSMSGYNLVFAIAGTTDKVTIQDFFGAWQYKIGTVQFSADGTSWSYKDIIQILTTGGSGNDVLNGDGGNNTLDGKAGNDTLNGNGGCDTYVFGRGYGQDTIKNYHNYSTERSVLKFNSDTAPSDVLVRRSGDNLVFTILGTTDSISVDMFFWSSSYEISSVQFSDGTTWDRAAIVSHMTTGTAGDDALQGDATNNVFDGMTGNDKMTGNGGSDTYLFGRGYGQDIIYNEHYDSGASVLRFLPDTLSSDIIISRSGNELVLSIAGTTDKVTIYNYFGGSAYRLASITFSDGTSWSYQDMVAKITAGTPGADKILGTYAGEVLDGGAGNDTLTGNGGSDTYVFGRGYGQDIINNEHYDSGASILKFNADTNPSDVVVVRSGSHLVLTIAGTTDTVTVSRYFAGSWYQLSSIQFSDGTSWNYQTIINAVTQGGPANDALSGDGGNNTIDGHAGNDTLTGNGGSDTYVFGRGYGQDIIYNEHYDSGKSILRFNADTMPSDVVAARSGSDLVLSISGTTDKVTINKYFSGSYYQLAEIQFSDGTSWSYQTVSAFKLGTPVNDTVTGSNIADTFYASAGVDTLIGAGGYDIYKVGTNVGQTVINNLASDGFTTAQGEVDFASGITSDKLWFVQNGNDLQIDFLGTSSTLKLSDWFAGNPRAQVQSFNTSNGLKLDSQLSQLVSAMASYAAQNTGFNPTTATTMPTDSALQSAIAAAWHA